MMPLPILPGAATTSGPLAASPAEEVVLNESEVSSENDQPSAETFAAFLAAVLPAPLPASTPAPQINDSSVPENAAAALPSSSAEESDTAQISQSNLPDESLKDWNTAPLTPSVFGVTEVKLFSELKSLVSQATEIISDEPAAPTSIPADDQNVIAEQSESPSFNSAKENMEESAETVAVSAQIPASIATNGNAEPIKISSAASKISPDNSPDDSIVSIPDTFEDSAETTSTNNPAASSLNESLTKKGLAKKEAQKEKTEAATSDVASLNEVSPVLVSTDSGKSIAVEARTESTSIKNVTETAPQKIVLGDQPQRPIAQQSDLAGQARFTPSAKSNTSVEAFAFKEDSQVSQPFIEASQAQTANRWPERVETPVFIGPDTASIANNDLQPIADIPELKEIVSLSVSLSSESETSVATKDADVFSSILSLPQISTSAHEIRPKVRAELTFNKLQVSLSTEPHLESDQTAENLLADKIELPVESRVQPIAIPSNQQPRQSESLTPAIAIESFGRIESSLKPALREVARITAELLRQIDGEAAVVSSPDDIALSSPTFQSLLSDQTETPQIQAVPNAQPAQGETRVQGTEIASIATASQFDRQIDKQLAVESASVAPDAQRTIAEKFQRLTETIIPNDSPKTANNSQDKKISASNEASREGMNPTPTATPIDLTSQEEAMSEGSTQQQSNQTLNRKEMNPSLPKGARENEFSIADDAAPTHTMNVVAAHPPQMMFDRTAPATPAQAALMQSATHIINAAEAVKPREARTMRFELRPESLGRVEIELTRNSEGHLRAHLTAERGETSQFLQDGLSQLRESLERAGINVDRLDVSMRGDLSAQTGSHQQRQQEGHSPSASVAHAFFGHEQPVTDDAPRVVENDRLISLQA